jgi:hypothetical protein
MNDKVVVLPVSDAAELAQRLLEDQPKTAMLVMVNGDTVTIKATYIEDVMQMFGALEFAKLHLWSGL